MKAASEGSEIQLVWPATIPQQAGRVTAIDDEGIDTIQDSGRRQRYKLLARRGRGNNCTSFRLHPYVAVGDRFGEGDTIIAAVMPESVPPTCGSTERYDFIADLRAAARETVDAATKALGFLPELRTVSIGELRRVATEHEDALVRLRLPELCAARHANRLGIDQCGPAVWSRNQSPYGGRADHE